jgi:hypothetical protein
MWEMAGGRTPTYAVRSRVDITGTAGVRIVEGVPGERSRRAVLTLRKVAAGARRSVAWAVTFASIGQGVCS